MTHLRRRRWLLVILLLASPALAYGFVQWRKGTVNGGQLPAEPFRIAGNLYYVGANDVASFLITDPAGHILIDGGYPGTPPLIKASIQKLGFNIRDVKVLLNSEPHYDHAGGLAELQRASGAEIWASESSAKSIEGGGYEEYAILPARILVASRILHYEPARVAHRFADGTTIRVGNSAVTAHITAGHTRGCTSWSFTVQDNGRPLHVVSACSLLLLPGVRLTTPQRYPGVREDFEGTLRTLRSLPVDIWVTSHARLFGRYRKYQAMQAAPDSGNPFIDPSGYKAYVDSGEARFRRLLAEQEK